MMEICVERWFQVKNDKKNHLFLLKEKRLAEKKLREKKTRIPFILITK